VYYQTLMLEVKQLLSIFKQYRNRVMVVKISYK